MSRIDDAIQLLGGPVAAAAKLDLTGYQVVQAWRREGRVPPKHCPVIERLLGGKVTCEELNPEVDWGYVRTAGAS